MQTDRPTLLKRFLSQLKEGDEMARACAAQELGKLRDRHAADALVEAMRDDPAPLVRRYAAAALGDLRQVAAIGPLVEALQDPTVAWHARQALRSIGTPSALAALQAAP